MYDMIVLEREIESERRLTLGGKHRLRAEAQLLMRRTVGRT